jgi:hypothetical protein
LGAVHWVWVGVRQAWKELPREEGERARHQEQAGRSLGRPRCPAVVGVHRDHLCRVGVPPDAAGVRLLDLLRQGLEANRLAEKGALGYHRPR